MGEHMEHMEHMEHIAAIHHPTTPLHHALRNTQAIDRKRTPDDLTHGIHEHISHLSLYVSA